MTAAAKMVKNVLAMMNAIAMIIVNVDVKMVNSHLLFYELCYNICRGIYEKIRSRI